MRTLKALSALLVILVVAAPTAAQPARLYDKETKSLIEQSRKTFDRFWDALDSNLKNTTFKGAAGEFVVKKIGEDYKNTIETADKRFGASYSASTEVGNIFKEAMRIHNYVGQQGAGMKGASEWQAHTNTLGQLAREYGGTFPPTEGQPYRRYTDKEVIDAAASIEQSSKLVASSLESTLKKDKATPEATRKAMVADAKQFGAAAKALGSAVKGGKPASAQVTTLFDQVKKAQTAIGGSSAAGTVASALGGVNAPLATLAAAFHMK